MSRPIWKGSISFGLVTIPVSLYPAEKPSEHQQFHMLDSRNNSRIHYERINDVTGKKVPWDDVVKGFEFEKGNYVIIDEKELQKKEGEQTQTVEIQNFIDQKSLDPLYLDKPYYLVPSKQGEKAYVLLRETLKDLEKIGLSKVLIRTKQYLAAVIPFKNSLLLELMRYPEEVRQPEDMELPKGSIKEFNISKSEMQMAEKLISTMSKKWDPKQYKDESRKILKKWVEDKIHKGKNVQAKDREKEETTPKVKTAKLINFMDLLKKSIEEKEKKEKKSKREIRTKTDKLKKQLHHKRSSKRK